MRKSELKFAIKNTVVKHYGGKGFTTTAEYVIKELYDAIEKAYSKKHNTKRIKTRFV